MAPGAQASPQSSGGSTDDWTAGPARQAAVIVLMLVAVLGAATSLKGRGREFATVAGASTLGVSPGMSLPDGRLDINSATAEELTLLPAIGPALATRIVADREENGAFESIEDLGRVTGIGPRTLAKVSPFVVVRRSDDGAHAEPEP